MKAVTLSAQGVQLGIYDVVVAGGMESMSRVPYINRNLRTGVGYGDQVAEVRRPAAGKGAQRKEGGLGQEGGGP